MGSGATQATRVPFLAAPAGHAAGPNTLETWVLSHVQNRLKGWQESRESPDSYQPAPPPVEVDPFS